MIIQHDLASMFSNRQLNIKDKEEERAAEKLASGYQINRAADDAAGLKVSEKMRRQIRDLGKASNNVSDGISLIQAADSALEESHSVLQRMNELAVQAANGTNTTVDRDAIQLEMDALGEELTRIAETTCYNNHIYPLASESSAVEGVTGIQLPSEIKEVTIICLNDTGYSVEFDGKIYVDGEMITDRMLCYDDAGVSRKIAFELSEIYTINGQQMYSGGLRGGIIDVDFTQVVTLSTIFPTLNTPIEFCWALGCFRKEDVMVDSDGYLYVESNFPLWLSWYFDPVFGMSVIKNTNCLKELSSGSSATTDTDSTVGSILQQVRIQSGAEANRSVDIPLVDARASTLGVEYLDVMTHTYASEAIRKIQAAIGKVSSYRSMFGAYQNRLEHAQASQMGQGVLKLLE